MASNFSSKPLNYLLMDIFALMREETGVAARRLSEAGFAEPARALEDLRLIMEEAGKPPPGGALSAIVEACSASADPDSCLSNFERVSAGFTDRGGFMRFLSRRPGCASVLAPLFASSQFLARFILGDPEGVLAWLLAPGRLEGPRGREEFVRECLRAVPPEPLPEAAKRLRRFKYMEFLRITARDLLGRADLAETTLELSNLADASLEAALRAAARELDKRHGPPRVRAGSGRTGRCPFTVIAMGKLGGRELNFSSDVDIMYLYLSGDGETKGPRKITNHQYAVKLGGLINKLMAERTEDGFVFRVDTRLRPEGERGELAQSLAGYETYYESWGQTWERAALIKARPCAGDMELGRAFIDTVRPFVYRKYLDYSAISEIRDMKQRVERRGQGGPKAAGEIDLKLGYGGIREVEFFIQALQLIYGGRDAGIRERGTLKALHRLAIRNLVTFEEQRVLAKAYEFLRTAEHRLQVVDERQLHSFPDTAADVEALARRMGFRAKGASAGDMFREELRGHTARVREVYDGLLKEQAVDVVETADALDALLAAELDEETAAGVLAEKGFREPHQAYLNFLLLRDGSFGSPLTPRGRNLFMKIIPALVSGCAGSPDPDMALGRLESFITSFGSREALYDLISDRPEAARRITKIFGTSEYFSQLLIAHPEMGDALLFAGEEAVEKGREEMASELAAVVGAAQGLAPRMDLLRRYKHSEEIRIGVKDIIENPGYRAVSHSLTTLAEVALGETLRMVADDLGPKYGLPRGLKEGKGAAVAGFGKLGAGELGYGSDLDIVFLYEGPGPADAGPADMKIGVPEFYARFAERAIFALSSLTREGVVFRVDTRLRPGGSKGVLAHTVGSLKRYYEKDASVWELQALTRARAVAGDGELCRAFEQIRRDVLARPREKAGLASAVMSMRLRVEKELGGKKKAGYHIKYGRGGIADMDFIVQYMQLLHGAAHPEILTTDAPAAIEVAVRLGLIPAGDGASLKGSYVFMKELESRLRITTSQPETVLPEDTAKLGMLAARMGYKAKGEAAARELLEDYKRHSEEVRRIFERIFTLTPGPSPAGGEGKRSR